MAMPVELIVLILAVVAAAALITSWWGVRRLQQTRARADASVRSTPPTPVRQKVALVLNPVKLNAAAARHQVELACSEAGWDPPLVLDTTVEDPGYGQALLALQAGADVVLAAGGDGTVRAVAHAVAHHGAALGLIPLGTGNLLARNLGMSVGDIHRSVRQALHGSQRRIDMGRIELRNDLTGTGTQHVFLVMGGIGLDAKVVAATRQGLKKRLGWLAYSEAGMRVLPGRGQRVSISLNDQPAQNRKVRSVLFANCGKLPGGIEFIPDSTIDDGFLDVVVISPRSLLGWAWVAAKILFRHRGPTPVIKYYQAKKVTISVSEPTETQLDGDLSGAVTSLTVEVDPGALTVRVPREAAGPSARMFSKPRQL